MAEMLLIAYFGTLGALAVLGVHRLALWLASIGIKPRVPTALSARPPTVLVQIPVYNELFVAERIIRAVGELRYPQDRLQVQILDDSTDETRHVVDRAAVQLRERGTRAEVVRRSQRQGYKAGALAYGLAQAESELVAIFDADFVPDPDFLERLVPVLEADRTVGLVQARWGHLNRTQSWLTRAQAVFLDGHFAVEHRARARLGHFFNFNGTAGIWRREAIEAAGGWRADTITEDLDLSYRAQLAGYRFCYAHEVVAPAELPESWTAFRSQQARWVRGSVQTARLLLRPLLRAALPARVRLDALVHLTGNFAYLLMAVLAVLLPAAVVVRDQLGWRVPGGQPLLTVFDLVTLGAGTLAMVVFYGAASGRVRPGPWWLRLSEVAWALCVGAGMSLANAQEVVRGLGRRPAEFVRTPKRGASDGERLRNTYLPRLRVPRAALEIGGAAYYAAAVVYALRWSLWGALPFLLLYALGFLAVGVGTVWETRGVRLIASLRPDGPHRSEAESARP